VYSVGATGLFLCLEANPGGPNGKELWRHDLLAEFGASLPTWGIASSPLIEGDLVIVQPGGRTGSVVAFDRTTGEKRWATGKNPNGYSSPIAATVGGVRQVVAVTGDAILGVRPSDGKQLWSHPWVTEHRGNIATPVVVDANHVFVSSGYGKGCVLLQVSADGDGAKVKELYYRKARVMKNHHSSCVARGEYLYGYDDETLRCVDWKKGQAKADWEGVDDNGRNLRKGSVILADKHLIGLTETGTLFLAEAKPEEFELLGQLPGVLTGGQCWALPVLADGRIYLRDAEKVVCLDVK
jgi:outer membrane protein assembly factor BamB